MKLAFSVFGPPVPKERARSSQGQHYTPKRTREYEQLIGWHARQAMLKCKEERWDTQREYAVRLAVYVPDKRRRDVDNLVKSCLDGCNGILWVDDSQVVECSVRKIVSCEPRIEMEVRSVG